MAAKAYARANELTGRQEPDLLVGEGEALGLATDRDLRGKPRELFDAALALDANNGKALWYAGMSAAQSGENEVARQHWTALSKQDLPQELRTVLDERLAALGVEAGPPSSGGPQAVSAGTAAPAPGAVELRVKVAVAPELQSRVPPDATLFVFAKVQQGPPMPLAVFRGSAGGLPMEVTLNDSMAMTPAAKISQFDHWVVTARVSRAGQAQAVSGDLQGSLTVARGELGTSALVLTIGEVVP